MPRLFMLLLALSSLTACTLTADEVEPGLPAVPVFQTNTVAYRLNGLPVVAHNYGTVISAVFSFGRNSLPVAGFLRPDSTLEIGAVDAQNYAGPGSIQRTLEWQLLRFRGAGRYPLVPGGSFLQLDPYDAATHGWATGRRQPLSAQPTAEVVVTSWEPATQRIKGTFTMRFDAAGNEPAADLQEGQFDLTLGR